MFSIAEAEPAYGVVVVPPALPLTPVLSVVDVPVLSVPVVSVDIEPPVAVSVDPDVPPAVLSVPLRVLRDPDFDRCFVRVEVLVLLVSGAVVDVPSVLGDIVPMPPVV